MSRRPRRSVDPLVVLAQRYDRMAPGGTIDSESPVHRTKSMAGGVGVEPACGVDYPRTAIDSTTADFVLTSPYLFGGLTIEVAYTTDYVGDIDVRVTSVDASSGPLADNTPTGWETITGPGTGTVMIPSSGPFVATNLTLTGFRIEWDIPGGLSILGCCATPIDNI